jgi:serine/threonine protein kinase
MRLASGEKLGAYEILDTLGAGGTGAVYRARDTKLEREVSIKVLPEAFETDSERVARFEREAKLLATLNHPGIATLHGLEEAQGKRFLVMELVEGETLADRIDRGTIPYDDALLLFHQVAEALEAAHEKGVVHRDLMPANIQVTP